MTKSCEDMEDIIRILVDMFDNMNVDFNTVMLKVRDKNYCLFCMQHYRHCKCDFANVTISSDSEDDQSSHDTTDDYTSSECETEEETPRVNMSSNMTLPPVALDDPGTSSDDSSNDESSNDEII